MEREKDEIGGMREEEKGNVGSRCGGVGLSRGIQYKVGVGRAGAMWSFLAAD